MPSEIEGFLRERGKAAFMPYVTAGYPSPRSMPGIFSMLRDSGADCLELGVPFSDPVADGPVIQESTRRALASGVTPDSALRMAEAASRTGLRVLLMGYSNPFLHAGLERVADRASSAGVSGLIIPDLPLEEAGQWASILGAHGLALPLFAAPTTPPARLMLIARRATGFIYYVSVTGVTGERGRLSPELGGRLRWLKRTVGKPVCVGFGVSTAPQAASVASLASGVIVGSALVRRLAEWTAGPGKRRKIAHWVSSMARAVHGG
jgi:tryptophan synthase alpha chain